MTEWPDYTADSQVSNHKTSTGAPRNATSSLTVDESAHLSLSACSGQGHCPDRQPLFRLFGKMGGNTYCFTVHGMGITRFFPQRK